MITKIRQRVPAGKFKATCLALLDRVATTGEEFVITKRGRPVAKLVPAEPADEGELAGSIVYEEDLVAPLGDRWEAAQ
ncbi:MAG: type II toxin-antitoxin system Phd/YefM family antitoxin [Candidatus Dadabacteria bacterium]|nr:MAG: type II toxin-antitoxin system Phd/YefM family antitoxin [Candidatus Dadabacteria bacterium]